MPITHTCERNAGQPVLQSPFISTCVTGLHTVHATISRFTPEVYSSSASVVTGERCNSAHNYTIPLLVYLRGTMVCTFFLILISLKLSHSTHCTEQRHKTFAQAHNNQQTMEGPVTTVSCSGHPWSFFIPEL